MTTAQVSAVAARFLDALSRRDFDALAATFAEDGVFRGLLPSVLREAEGREAIAERFAIWFEDVEHFGLVQSGADEIADVTRIRWRIVGEKPDVGQCVIEQTAYARVESGGIGWMNLVCSGFRPVPAE